MRIQALLLLGSVVAGLLATDGWAFISVKKGEYAVPARIALGPDGPIAVFNARSHSELRLHLKGAVASKLAQDMSAQKAPPIPVVSIRFKIGHDLREKSYADAQLISFDPLATGAEASAPTAVGNDFKPLVQPVP